MHLTPRTRGTVEARANGQHSAPRLLCRLVQVTITGRFKWAGYIRLALVSDPCRRQLTNAPVISGLKTAIPPAGTPSSYAATMFSGMGAKSATRRKSRNDVPVEALSVFGAPRLLTTSSMLMVRKSMLQRTKFVVFGTVE